MSLRDIILGAPDRLVSVTVPEWGVEVWVRRLHLSERAAFEEAVGQYDKLDRDARNAWMVKYVIETACDAAGKPIFSPEDEAALSTKAATALERILLTAFRVNTTRMEDLANLGNVSEPLRNGSSPSGSAVT